MTTRLAALNIYFALDAILPLAGIAFPQNFDLVRPIARKLHKKTLSGDDLETLRHAAAEEVPAEAGIP